jgi:hypothetical protein
MPSPHHPKQNHLLASLREATYGRLLPDLELIAMPLEFALYESGDDPRYVYFPTTSVVSLLYTTGKGSWLETAIVGAEGLVGDAAFTDEEPAPGRAIVHCGGFAYRIRTPPFMKEFENRGDLERIAKRYAGALSRQITQTAICTQSHIPEQQLCRWLLLTADRQTEGDPTISQGLLANLSGVGVELAAGAARKLHEHGAIDIQRGQIKVVNRRRLEARVCECYGVLRREFDRLMRIGAPGESDGAPNI